MSMALERQATFLADASQHPGVRCSSWCLGFNSSVPQRHSGSVTGRPRSRRPAPEAPETSAKVFPTLRPVSLRAELHRSPTAQVELALLSLHTVFATRYICAFSFFQEIDSE